MLMKLFIREIRTFVRQLELDPKNKEVRAAFYPDKVVQSIGAWNRTWTGTGREAPGILSPALSVTACVC